MPGTYRTSRLSRENNNRRKGLAVEKRLLGIPTVEQVEAAISTGLNNTRRERVTCWIKSVPQGPARDFTPQYDNRGRLITPERRRRSREFFRKRPQQPVVIPALPQVPVEIVSVEVFSEIMEKFSDFDERNELDSMPRQVSVQRVIPGLKEYERRRYGRRSDVVGKALRKRQKKARGAYDHFNGVKIRNCGRKGAPTIRTFAGRKAIAGWFTVEVGGYYN